MEFMSCPKCGLVYDAEIVSKSDPSCTQCDGKLQ